MNTFTGGVALDGAVFAWRNFIYYSYVTQTTLGYDDILPVTMFAKVAVSIEAIVGVMYLTIIIGQFIFR